MVVEALVSSIKLMNQNLVKLKPLDGNNFTSWQDKKIFLPTAFKIFYVLDSMALIPKLQNDDFKELKTKRKNERRMNYYVMDTLRTQYQTVHIIYTQITSQQEKL